MNDLFHVCYREAEEFCDDKASTASNHDVKQSCDFFEFSNLTVGQVASASSAAVGGGAVQAWVQSLIELVRRKAKDALQGSVNFWYCKIYQLLIENVLGPCNRKVVLGEFSKLIGCGTDSIENEASEITAKRWAGFFQKMAIQMTVNSPLENDHQGHMAIDAVRATHQSRACVHKIPHQDWHIDRQAVTQANIL